MTAPLLGDVIVMPGGVVSSVIVSVVGVDQLPAASANLTETVFEPSPAGSVHVLTAAYGSAAE